MRSPIFFTAFATSVAALEPFVLPGLTTHQPNGNRDSDSNFDEYNIKFNISSVNSGSTKTGYCSKLWEDNDWDELQRVAYSTSVPNGTWFQCDSSNSNLGDGDSVFQFKLFPYFSIGDYSIEVKETLGSDKSIYGYTHITNTTSSYTCTINPLEIEYVVHATGDCGIADGKGPVEIPAAAKEESCWV